MVNRYLCAWVLVAALVGCVTDRTGVEPTPHGHVPDRDPYVGQYIVFERYGNGYIESRRYGGRIEIEKRGEAYVLIKRDRETWFRHNRNGVLEPDPAHNSATLTAIIELNVAAIGTPPPSHPEAPEPIKQSPQHGVEIVESFQVLYAVQGVGPASWYIPNDWTHEGKRPQDIWQYRRHISAAGSRSERITGELTCLDEPIADAKPGTILLTPIGKFMYFGKPDRQAYQSGWLNTSTYGKPIFNDDGSLTEYGAERRAWMKRETYSDSFGPMPQDRLEMIAALVKPGMSPEQVRTAIKAHLGDRGAIALETSGPSQGGLDYTISLWDTTGEGGVLIRYRSQEQADGSIRYTVADGEESVSILIGGVDQ